MELVPYSGIGFCPCATGCCGEPVPAASELSSWASACLALAQRQRRCHWRRTAHGALRAVCLGRDTAHECPLDGRVIDLDVQPREHGVEAELEAIHEHHALGQRHEIATFLEHDLFHVADLDHQLADE